MNRRLVLLCCMLSSLVLTTACGLSETPIVTSIPEGTAIDPVFREFYNYLGGVDVLGAAIAASAQESGITTQYIETGKLVFDPAAAPVNRFRLESLGTQMGIGEPPVPPPGNPGLHYENGHVIFPDFYPLYEKLGALTVGKPLTEVRYNMIRKRYEQYFENLGFYRLEGTPEVRLLSYGVWACADCILNSRGPQNATIDVKSGGALHPAFRNFVQEHGADFTGFPLQAAGVAGDGKWEQILENVVVVTDAQQGQTPVDLRPLSEALHIPAEPPRPYSADPNMYFYPVNGTQLGYEIPIFFWNYIGQHGGLAVFGPPVTHYTLLSGMIHHQCFRNLCLMYDEGATEQARIRPEPFGYAYKLLYGKAETVPLPTPTVAVLPTLEPTALPPAQVIPLEPTATLAVELTNVAPASGGVPEITRELPPAPFLTPTAPNPKSMREITMQVWGRYNVVSSKQAQEISVWITENDLPSRGALVDLTVKLPDGSDQTFQMPPTGANGQSNILLPLISGPDSTLVPYRACYQTSPDTRMCIADFFMLWNNP